MEGDVIFVITIISHKYKHGIRNQRKYERLKKKVFKKNNWREFEGHIAF